MSLPTFSKVDVTTVTFSKANVYPIVSPRTLNQFVGISDNNTIRVAVLGPPLEVILLQFRQLTRDDRSNLIAFFEAIDYSDEFTYTDTVGAPFTVRLLEPNFTLPEVVDNNVSFDITLTKV